MTPLTELRSTWLITPGCKAEVCDARGRFQKNRFWAADQRGKQSLKSDPPMGTLQPVNNDKSKRSLTEIVLEEPTAASVRVER